MVNAAAVSFIVFRFFPTADCVRVVIIPPFPFQHSAPIRFLCRNGKGTIPHSESPLLNNPVAERAEVARRDQESRGPALAHFPVKSVSLWLFSGYRIPMELSAIKEAVHFRFVFICLAPIARAPIVDTRFAGPADALP